MTSLAKDFEMRVGSGIPAIMVRSWEPEEAIIEMQAVCREQGWRFATYDIHQGFVHDVAGSHDMVASYFTKQWVQTDKNNPTAVMLQYVEQSGVTTDPETAIESLPGLNYNKRTIVDGAASTTPAVLVMKNPQRWLNTGTLVQMLANRLYQFKGMNCHVVLLGSDNSLPVELRKLFESGHIKHPLPGPAEIAEIVTSIAQPEELPEDGVGRIADALAGLTRLGVEDVTAICVREHRKVTPEAVFELKAQAFENASRSLKIYHGGLTLDDYGGGAFLKQFCLDMLAIKEANPRFRSKGIFLCGPGGVGKTHFAKCLGSAVGRATAIARLGRNKSKYQGESGANLDEMLETLRAMSPCIALFDEVEGQVSGGKDTGAIDGGTKAEMNSELLSFMDNRDDKDVFILAACNDIRPILRDMPEFTRLGRFDGLFFLDYPGPAARADIWKLHLVAYEHMDPFQTKEEGKEAFAKFCRDKGLPDDTNWTGAEIEACCAIARKRRASGKTLAMIGNDMGTISQRDTGTIKAVREWAEQNRCYSSEVEGLYSRAEYQHRLQQEAEEMGLIRRAVIRKPVPSAITKPAAKPPLVMRQPKLPPDPTNN